MGIQETGIDKLHYFGGIDILAYMVPALDHSKVIRDPCGWMLEISGADQQHDMVVESLRAHN